MTRNTILDSLPAMTWSAQVVGSLDSVNRTWAAYTGLTDDESIGSGWTRAFGQEDVERLLSCWKQAASELACFEVECKVFNEQVQDYRWHLAKGAKLEEDVGWLVSFTEIERFKKTEQSLLDNEVRLNEAIIAARKQYEHIEQLLVNYLHNMPALSFIKDDQGRYLYASRSFCKFFEVDFEQFLYKTDMEWLDPSVAKQFMQNDQHVRNSGVPLQTIERVPKNGSVIQSVVQKFPLRPSGGADEECSTSCFIGGIAIDVTSQQEAEERAKSLAEDLQYLAYVVSHELQEPIRTIVSYQNLLSARYRSRLGPDADSFINRCTDAALLIQAMIDDLWTYARISKHADFENHSANTLLQEALKNLAPLIESSHAVILCDDLPPVNGAGKLIIQLFEELIANAIKHCRRKDVVVKISGEQLDGRCKFFVEDNGPGIDPMSRRDVFKLFRRENARPDATGTGMGLAICMRIVQHHAGEISIESADSGGSTVVLTLPAALT